MKKICIVGASGKLGRYMVRHALERGYEVVAVCRAASVAKLAGFGDRITIVPGATDDRRVIEQAVAGCDGVLTVLVPWGMQRYASGTAQAVLDFAPAHARLVFSCGWHITRDGKDVYPMSIRAAVAIGGWLLRLLRVGEIDDQVEACRRVFASDARWTVVRGSNLEEGGSDGLPVWSEHVGDAILASNRTRRIDFALFMVAALTDEDPDRMLPKEASMVKLFVTEVAKRTTLEGMQMMGGYGYSSEYDMERLVRTSLVSTIYGGTSEIQRGIIAKTLGL